MEKKYFIRPEYITAKEIKNLRKNDRQSSKGNQLKWENNDICVSKLSEKV